MDAIDDVYKISGTTINISSLFVVPSALLITKLKCRLKWKIHVGGSIKRCCFCTVKHITHITYEYTGSTGDVLGEFPGGRLLVGKRGLVIRK